jgi:hypothetical protein
MFSRWARGLRSIGLPCSIRINGSPSMIV